MPRVITAPQIAIAPMQLVQSEPSQEPDPYVYGWREVCRTLPSGERVWEQIPLTLEDALHPQIGDFRVHSDQHERICTYLHNVLDGQLAHDRNAFVVHDLRTSWADPDLKPIAPDIAVIFNVRKRQDWSTFDTKKEGTIPTLVIEVTSPKTRSADLNEKVSMYEQAGVPLYVVVDRAKGKKRTKRRLIGYEMTPIGYVRMKTNELGWLWLEPVQLWLAFRGGGVVCFDKLGNLVADYKTVVDQRDEARRQAAIAKAKAHAEAQARAKAYAQAQAERKRRQAEAYARARAEAEAQAQAQARAKAEAEAKAQAQAKAKAEAEAKAQAQARAKAEAEAKAQAEARANAEAQAQAEREQRQAEADARAKAEAEAQAEREQRQAEADARAKAEAEAKASACAKAKAEAEAQAEREQRQAEAEARANAEAEAKASACAKAKAEAQAEAEREQRQAEADARAKAEAEAKAQAEARAKAEAQALEAAKELERLRAELASMRKK